MTESRAYTDEEVRDQILRHIKALVGYWANENSVQDPKEKLDGLAFSILSMLDGCSLHLPAFNLVPDPHPDDKEYHQENGDNWYESNPLSFHLHEYYSRMNEKGEYVD